MPYGSARDLPALVEMERQLKFLRLLRWVLPSAERELVQMLPAQVSHLATTVDAFYEVLGPRNWIFHEALHVDEMATLVAENGHDPERAERALIDWYRADVRLAGMVRRLNGFEGMRSRMHLLERALDDFQSGRHYAVVQVLLSVMDGFVNDLDPGSRKGLHARSSEEMDAWNSVVGHHLGLTSAHQTFTALPT